MTLYEMPAPTVSGLVGQLVHFTAGGIPYQGLLTAFDATNEVATVLVYGPGGQQYTTQFSIKDMVGLGPGLIQQGGGGGPWQQGGGGGQQGGGPWPQGGGGGQQGGGPWPQGGGPWPQGGGPWPQGGGPWQQGGGPWPQGGGPWPQGGGPWPQGGLPWLQGGSIFGIPIGRAYTTANGYIVIAPDDGK